MRVRMEGMRIVAENARHDPRAYLSRPKSTLAPARNAPNPARAEWTHFSLISTYLSIPTAPKMSVSAEASTLPKMLVETFEEKEARLVDLVAKCSEEVEKAPEFVAIFRDALNVSEAKLLECGEMYLSAVQRDREHLEHFTAAAEKWSLLHASVVEQLAAHRASRA